MVIEGSRPITAANPTLLEYPSVGVLLGSLTASITRTTLLGSTSHLLIGDRLSHALCGV
jgi:hypothetical protein